MSAWDIEVARATVLHYLAARDGVLHAELLEHAHVAHLAASGEVERAVRFSVALGEWRARTSAVTRLARAALMDTCEPSTSAEEQRSAARDLGRWAIELRWRAAHLRPDVEHMMRDAGAWSNAAWAPPDHVMARWIAARLAGPQLAPLGVIERDEGWTAEIEGHAARLAGTTRLPAPDSDSVRASRGMLNDARARAEVAPAASRASTWARAMAAAPDRPPWERLLATAEALNDARHPLASLLVFVDATEILGASPKLARSDGPGSMTLPMLSHLAVDFSATEPPRGHTRAGVRAIVQRIAHALGHNVGAMSGAERVRAHRARDAKRRT